MAVREILLLGHPGLYTRCTPVQQSEVGVLQALVQDLHDTMMDFRRRYQTGRAIAAPQINAMKRLVYMHIDQPVVFFNPILEDKSAETMEIWDDCMSFPDLMVKVSRHRSCRIVYRDQTWEEQSMDLKGNLAELLQHEIDHLDGILAVQRAIDGKSFALRSQRVHLP